MIHPQQWTDDVDVRGKRVVVIGSGATAATLVPALAKQGAKRVVMLQRSPGYYIANPSSPEGLSKWIMNFMPTVGHQLNRLKHISVGAMLYWFCRTYPQIARKMLMGMIRKQTPRDFDVDTHFNPKYNPWEQRLCLVPDGDFFEAIRDGSVDVVTDHVDCFVESGVRTATGRVIDADICVTATGLNLQTNFPMSNVHVEVDGHVYNSPEGVMYRGIMLADIPNFSFTFGYANASWTLKAELASEFVCRVLNAMDAKKKPIVCPRKLGLEFDDDKQFFDLSSGYLMRVKDRLPKQGSSYPWVLHQSYFRDSFDLRYRKLEDGALKFEECRSVGTGYARADSTEQFDEEVAYENGRGRHVGPVARL